MVWLVASAASVAVRSKSCGGGAMNLKSSHQRPHVSVMFSISIFVTSWYAERSMSCQP